jgi:hypothetical protein
MKKIICNSIEELLQEILLGIYIDEAIYVPLLEPLGKYIYQEEY